MAAAARLHDPIGHSPTMSWLVRGLIAGAAIATAGVLIVGTGGLAAVALVGGIAAMGAGLGEVLSTMSWAPKEVCGTIAATGSSNVFTNGVQAARAYLDLATCLKHPGPPLPISTGSSTVFINNVPAARVNDTIACGAVITSGSNNVYIGGGLSGPKSPENLVPGWVHGALLVVGFGAAVAGGAAAGLGSLAAVAVATVGFGGAILGGMGAAWLGGKIFGDGSDGQKWCAFGGAVIGGTLAGAGATAGFRFATIERAPFQLPEPEAPQVRVMPEQEPALPSNLAEPDATGATSVRPLNPGTRFYVNREGEVLDAKTYSRNTKFRAGVRDEVWTEAEAVNPETNRVTDPLSGEFMNKAEPWDMGHRPGMEYWKERDNAINQWLDSRAFTTRKEFLDTMNDPSRYRPELPSSNRSHKGEDHSNDFYE